MGEVRRQVGMLFKRTYSVSTKSPVAPQSPSALVLRFIAVSVVSISMSMLSELSLGVVAMTNFFGRRRSQLASRMRAIFWGGGEGCGTTFTQSNMLVASSHLSTTKQAYRLRKDSGGVLITRCVEQNPLLMLRARPLSLQLHFPRWCCWPRLRLAGREHR